jgi:TPP-dependent pyruvate/acetoin dehydrogenase alpha subunit
MSTSVLKQIEDKIVSDREAFDVLCIRYWHHLLNERLKKKQFKIPIHLGFGHEAAVVAMDRVMEPSDQLCLTHRNAAYNLARSKSLNVVLQHYQLSLSSTAGANMGSMNLAVEGVGIAYSSSILGNNLAVAAGIAMHRSLIHKPGVIFVVTGDGAIEEGIFWETLIFSQAHKLPLVIIIENNDMSMSSTILQRRSAIDLSKVCAGIGFQYFQANGAILFDAKNTLDSARKSAGAGAPACVELNLTTFCHHAGPTPGWSNDPLRIALEDGLLIEDTPRDPLYHIRNTLGLDEFQRLSKQVMEECQGE